MTLKKTAGIKGVLTALPTPFDEDEAIDQAALKAIVDRSIDGGVHGVVVGGSTGEFASLSDDERRAAVDLVTEHTAGRVPVVAQTGATTTREAIKHSRAAQASGADVLMLVTPYYEPLSLEETTDYIRTVASAVELPIMLYNIPAATGVNIDPDTAGSLAREFDNIKYIKDSSANWEQALQLIHHHSDVLGTVIGWDSYIFSALAEGAVGVLAGAANVIPEPLVKVYDLIAEEKLVEARDYWAKVYPVIDAIISEPFIPAVKAGLELQGQPAGKPRAPLAASTQETQKKIQTALAQLTTGTASAS